VHVPSCSPQACMCVLVHSPSFRVQPPSRLFIFSLEADQTHPLTSRHVKQNSLSKHSAKSLFSFWIFSISTDGCLRDLHETGSCQTLPPLFIQILVGFRATNSSLCLVGEDSPASFSSMRELLSLVPGPPTYVSPILLCPHAFEN